ncbi:hypothetical protein SPD48_03315 [Pseudogracilibacillus sp. SE30717A]|uniref:hypothetical protein n=1 Tax=Pseudogracilibacillus sp. SE30717A TaxID=3098293 RepID=UPI00300E0658
MTMEHEENQAEKLQQLFAEVTNQPIDQQESKDEETSNDYIEVDVLNLPPRSEVHTKPKQKVNVSFNSPLMRLFSVLILLIIIVTLIYFVAGEKLIHFFN